MHFHRLPRKFCDECQKTRPFVDGQCVVCTVKVQKTVEQIRLNGGDPSFANLNPEE